MIRGLKLTDGMVAGLKAVRAGKPVSAAMLKTLATLRLINSMELTPAGIAVLTKPARPKKFVSTPKKLANLPRKSSR
jgi:hypothetical protein